MLAGLDTLRCCTDGLFFKVGVVLQLTKPCAFCWTGDDTEGDEWMVTALVMLLATIHCITTLQWPILNPYSFRSSSFSNNIDDVSQHLICQN
jgi:hypothetical protein